MLKLQVRTELVKTYPIYLYISGPCTKKNIEIIQININYPVTDICLVRSSFRIYGGKKNNRKKN